MKPIDYNDLSASTTAVEIKLVDGLSSKAWLAWHYLDGAAFLFSYKGKLVLTDESGCLTEHGDGITAPFGCPRLVCDTIEELNQFLEDIWFDLEAEHSNWR